MTRKQKKNEKKSLRMLSTGPEKSEKMVYFTSVAIF